MPRPCSICVHPDREAIDRALVAGEPLRKLAERTGTSGAALHRHKTNHLAGLLAQAEERVDAHAADLRAELEERAAREAAHGLDLRAELRRCFRRVNLILDACDDWLRDPEDPSRYYVGPRAEDVDVTYWEQGSRGNPVRRRAPLSLLLGRLQGGGVNVSRWEFRHSDPRELFIKAAAQVAQQGKLLQAVLTDPEERAMGQLDALMAQIEKNAAEYEQAEQAKADTAQSKTDDRPGDGARVH